jgi:hypothetical protein
MKTVFATTILILLSSFSFGKDKVEYRSSICVENTEAALVAFIYAIQENHTLRASDVRFHDGIVITDYLEYDRSVDGIRTRLACSVVNNELSIRFVEITKWEVPTNSWVPAKERKLELKIREQLFDKIESVLASDFAAQLVAEYRVIQLNKLQHPEVIAKSSPIQISLSPGVRCIIENTSNEQVIIKVISEKQVFDLPSKEEGSFTQNK